MPQLTRKPFRSTGPPNTSRPPSTAPPYNARKPAFLGRGLAKAAFRGGGQRETAFARQGMLRTVFWRYHRARRAVDCSVGLCRNLIPVRILAGSRFNARIVAVRH